MVDANLRILINAVDKASPQLKGITGALSGIAGMVSPIALASAALIAIADYTKKATEETQAMNIAVLDTSKAWGISTEQTSRIIQAADDVRISQETIKMAMYNLSKQGISPTIENLGILADKYVEIQDPAQKVIFLTQNFGKAGKEMGRFLEGGASGVRSATDSISGALVVTEKAAAASLAFAQNTDFAADAASNLAGTLGNQTIPLMSNWNYLIGNALTVYDQFINKYITGTADANAVQVLFNKNEEIQIRLFLLARVAVERLGMGADGAAKQWEYYNSMVDVAVQETKDTGNAIAEASGQLDQLKPRVAEAGEFVREFGEKFTELKTVMSEGNFIQDAASGFSQLKDVGISVNDQIAAMNNHDMSGLGSSIKNALDLIDWKALGGDKLEEGFQQIQMGEAIGAITEPQAKALYDQLFIQQEALKVKMGEITQSAATADIAKTIGVPAKDAADRLAQAMKDSETGKNSVVDMIPNIMTVQDKIEKIDAEKPTTSLTEMNAMIVAAEQSANRVANAIINIPDTTNKKVRFAVESYWAATNSLPPGVQAIIMSIVQNTIAQADVTP